MKRRVKQCAKLRLAMQNWLDNYPKSELYWPDRHYISLLMTDKNKTFTWEYDNKIDYVARAAEYF